MAIPSNVLAWRIPIDRGAWRATVHGVKKSRTGLKWLSTQHSTAHSTLLSPESCVRFNVSDGGLLGLRLQTEPCV